MIKYRQLNLEILNPNLPDTCPYCGMSYDDLKTGETFQSIKDMLWVGDEDSSRWRYKRRHTVLGLWREVKQGLWRDHIEACEGEHDRIKEEGDTSFDFGPDYEITEF